MLSVSFVVLSNLEPDFSCHCIQINKITEMSLSANQEREEMEKKRLVWKVEGSAEESQVSRGGAVDPEKLVVELAPMQIRTFIINLVKKS